jgi:hypothetical protein
MKRRSMAEIELILIMLLKDTHFLIFQMTVLMQFLIRRMRCGHLLIFTLFGSVFSSLITPKKIYEESTPLIFGTTKLN